MIKFYQFLSDLSILQGVLLLTPLILLMVFLPYYRIIFNVIWLTITGQKPEIIYFDILLSPIISEKEQILGAVEPDIIISGSKATLYWQVKGASRIDLLPLGKNLRGNSTDVIISKTNREFSLTVHGLTGFVSSTISIPEENIKTLQTHKVSENEIVEQFNLIPQTNNFETNNRRLIVNNIKTPQVKIKGFKLVTNYKITSFVKKENPAFKTNPSLSKYNNILNVLNRK